MSQPPPDDEPLLLSDAAMEEWSVKPGPAEGDHPFSIGDALRYRTEQLLGWGGMGRVRLAIDRRLRREVAIKENTAGRPERLAREAWITARLEHPGIVPVYDAGQDGSGKLWYAMRLVRGQTLSAAIAAAETLPDRLALIRRFLAACEAVGYAHHAGVVHRDLKPDNIMIGEFGETQVVDWGLARLTDGAEPLPEKTLTVSGSVMGTPAYMSPEQAAGQPVDARSDVWSLGATLYELLTGSPPFSGESTSVLRQIITQPPPQVPLDVAPVELCAIARRAMQTDPDDRYPDARQMAADVERWLSGRRVEAHSYTPAQLARRAAVAWRAPLVVAALAAAMLVAGAIAAGARLAADRDRALAAEAVAQEARRSADAHLSQALIGQAGLALTAGARPEAEVLAAAALQVEESPVARGILAAFAATPAMERIAALPAPDCTRSALSPDGTVLACLREADLVLYTLSDTLTERWIRPVAAERVQFIHPTRLVAFHHYGPTFVLDVEDGILIRQGSAYTIDRLMASRPDELHLFQSMRFHDDGSERMFSAGTQQITTHAQCDDGRILAVDSNGGVFLRQADDSLLEINRVALVEEEQAFISRCEDDVLLLGGLRGKAAILDAQTGETRLLLAGQLGNIVSISRSPDRRLVATAGERGGAEVFDATTGTLLARTPSRRLQSARFAADGTLWTFGERLERWRLPEVFPPRAWEVGEGVTDVALSEDGQQLVTGSGDGAVRLWDRHSGELVWSYDHGDLVIKAVALEPGGHRIAIASPRTPGAVILDPAEDTVTVPDGAEIIARRVVWLASGHIVLTEWGLGPNVFGGDPLVYLPIFRQSTSILFDLATSPSHAVAAATDVEGGIWLIDPTSDAPVRRVLEDTRAHRVDIDDATPRRLALVGADQVEVVVAETGTVLHSLPAPHQTVFDAAFSPDGALLAAGLHDGSVCVWDIARGEVIAILKNHRQRVSSVEFSDDGSTLFSASWDGTVRTWGLSVLRDDREAIAAAVDARWGMSMEDALQIGLTR